MDETTLVNLRIGARRYGIRIDDLYLRQARRGLVDRANNALRSWLGLDAFEPRMARLFSQLVRPGDTALDVGANIGCTSILLAQLARQVTAFEPTPKSFALWQDNLGRSGHGNCVGLPIALGAEDKHTLINYNERNRSGAFVADAVQGPGDSAPIPVRRLDGLFPSLGLPRVDFIKLDVEGYEGRVIEGGWQTIQAHRPVLQLELNAWCLNALHRIALPDFLDFLLDRFPIVYAIEHDAFVDLREQAGRWFVMQRNAMQQRFKEMVVAFDPARLDAFHAAYRRLAPP